ncbi:response regulator transcription factor [Streptomyces sp. NPDC006487]|uniref:response regulator transcription factor n=1 Tax=Streptomyces sp. NPDC006487 TaxID=3364748 RepID=UPI0036C06E04
MTDPLATSPQFSDRETDVLGLLIGGGTYCAIARQLGISPHTVDTYLRRLRVKTGTANRTQLVVLALQQGYASRTAPHQRRTAVPAHGASASVQSQ